MSSSSKTASAGVSQSAPASTRVISVDALRGFDMFWIIGGAEVFRHILAICMGTVPPGIEAQLHHATWEGFTCEDLIMPLFLFIVGAAMPFSFAKRVESGKSTAALYLKVIRRVVILWVLGMMVQGKLLEFNLGSLQVFSNTLQAIAIGYLVAAIALIHLPRWGQAVLTASLLVGYWAPMTFVPFNGQPAGILEPNVNLASYIDRIILGRFGDGLTYAWILPSMSYSANVLLGVFAGHVLRAACSQWMKLLRLVLLGLGCLALGWIVAGGPIVALNARGITPSWAAGLCDWLWRVRFPMNKHIVTSSMVLWATGWSYLLLALFYLVIDVLGFRRWAFFFIVIGANAILVYVGAHLINFQQIGNVFVGGLAKNLGASHSEFLQAVGAALGPFAAFAIIWLILLYLYRKGTFVRV